MTKSYCDVCGKEIKETEAYTYFWKKDMFYDNHDHPFEDICPECFWMLHCCLVMMKETGWRPDFHEKLNSDNIWESDCAAHILSILEDRTKLKLF